jgi:hypothetical protein
VPKLFIRSFISLIALAALGVIARPAAAADSSASGFFAHFTIGGINTAIFPVNRLTGAGLGSTYNKSLNSGRYQRQLVLSGAGLMRPILTVNATNMLSHIRGGFGVDTISATGAAEVSGFTLTLQSTWVPPGPPDILFLRVSARSLLERGSYNYVAPKSTTVSGFAGIQDLVISGTLVGNKTLRFTGQPQENIVLYRTSTVTITLNQTTTTDLISCNPRCKVTPVVVRTGGLVISLKDAPISPDKVTGEIVIGAGDAGSEGVF